MHVHRQVELHGQAQGEALGHVHPLEAQLGEGGVLGACLVVVAFALATVLVAIDAAAVFAVIDVDDLLDHRVDAAVPHVVRRQHGVAEVRWVPTDER